MIGERFYKKALPVNFLLQVLQILLLQIFGFTLALARLRKILRFALAPVRARASESGKFIIFFFLYFYWMWEIIFYTSSLTFTIWLIKKVNQIFWKR